DAVSKALGEQLIIWNIKSTTKAQDGLYIYDTVQRLYDSQFGENDVKDISRYIKYGKLGDRKSTRLNSSHVSSSYAVFRLKKKKSRHESARNAADGRQIHAGHDRQTN